ncbi:hypothetical protein [Streptomyces sp. NPDC019224]|uniref:hypothetical protein n=1 Tax=Streptomyces sp. NPDC019224 TaxID=3154484 RepID=UPI0033DCA800
MRTWRRWIRIGWGILGDSRAIKRDLKRNPYRLMTARDRLLGEEVHDARNLRYTAMWRRENGHPAAAESYEQLVALRTGAWGADHPLVLDTRITLAHVRAEAGDGAGAARAYGQLVPDLVRALGAGHPRVALARRNQAYWRERPEWMPPVLRRGELEGRIREAVVLRKESHAVATLCRLAQVRWNLGDEAGAAEAYERLLRERTLRRGADHHVVLLTRLTLAEMRGWAGDAAGALEAYELLLADMERVLGPGHRGARWTRRRRDLWRGGAAGPAGPGGAGPASGEDR